MDIWGILFVVGLAGSLAALYLILRDWRTVRRSHRN